VQAQELTDLDERLDLAAQLIAESGNLPNPPQVAFSYAPQADYAALLRDTTIAIASDKAFSFIYQANLDLLQQMGAELLFFSPLAGETLPACDALYLPGGYPELYLDTLADNQALKNQITSHVDGNKPLLAECGGMLYLNKTLTDAEGEQGQMCGILDAHSTMQTSLAALGLVEGELAQGDALRGHTFHYSKTQSNEALLCQPVSQRGRKLDPVWQHKKAVASYIHWYFPSNPALIARVFKGEL
jgi:cobyrinic acid a,c-diamide synthase